MKTLLTRTNAAVLDRLTGADALLAFDFDGTLAPLVARPADARMTPVTARLFRRLCDEARCVVVSGRARDDVAGRLGRARVAEVLGNHGIEPGGDLRRLQRENARLVAQLVPRLGHLDGVELEDKLFSHSWHHRRAPASARRVILRAVRSLGPAARVVTGKCVVNVVPSGAPDKGSALRSLARRMRARHVLFVGDDVTDEDVFRRDDVPGLVGVRVGRRRDSRAEFVLRDRDEVDDLLRALLARLTARRGPRSSGPAAARPAARAALRGGTSGSR